MNARAFYGFESGAVVTAALAFADASRTPSHGEVKRNELLSTDGTPARDGALSEKIFGPLERLRCRCGATRGETSVDVVCPRCGVLCGDPSERARRWGHVALAAPVLHPVVVPLIATLLRASEDSVLAVARHEAWWHDGDIFSPPGYTPAKAPGVPIWDWEPQAVNDLEPDLRELYRVNQALRRLGALPAWAEEHFSDEAAWYDEALAGCGVAGLRAALDAIDPDRAAAFERTHGFAPRDLLFSQLPIAPPDARPFVLRPGGLADPGPINRAIAKLVWKNRMLLQLHEAEADVLSSRTLERLLQLAFEELVARARGEAAAGLAPRGVETLAPIRAPEPEERLTYEFLEDAKPVLLRKVVSLALAADVAMVGLPAATFFVHLDSGLVELTATSPTLHLVGADALASHAVFLHPTHSSMHVFDIAGRRWCTERPAFLRYALERVNEGEVRVIDVASGSATTVHAHRFVPSACGRLYLSYIDQTESLTGETSFRIATVDGEPVFEPAGGTLTVLREDGTLRSYEDDSDVYAACAAADGLEAAAVVLSDSDELLTFAGGTFWRGARAVFAVSFQIVACAFDTLGQRLLCATPKRLLLFDVRTDAPTLVASYELKPLFEQMATSRTQCSFHALSAVLAKHGTLAAVAKRSAAELATIPMRDEHWDQAPVPLEEARKIVQMAKRVGDLRALERPGPA